MAGHSLLSRVQSAVLLRIAAGRRDREIARELGLKVGDVSRLTGEACRLLGAPTLAVAVLQAVRVGLIRVEPAEFPELLQEHGWDELMIVPASAQSNSFWLTDSYGQRVRLQVDRNCRRPTELESRVLLRLATGEPAKSVAEHRNAAWVRETTDRVFGKLDAHSLPETLMKLVALKFLTVTDAENAG